MDHSHRVDMARRRQALEARRLARRCMGPRPGARLQRHKDMVRHREAKLLDLSAVLVHTSVRNRRGQWRVRRCGEALKPEGTGPRRPETTPPLPWTVHMDRMDTARQSGGAQKREVTEPHWPEAKLRLLSLWTARMKTMDTVLKREVTVPRRTETNLGPPWIADLEVRHPWLGC
jgi:hypothetical protein